MEWVEVGWSGVGRDGGRKNRPPRIAHSAGAMTSVDRWVAMYVCEGEEGGQMGRRRLWDIREKATFVRRLWGCIRSRRYVWAGPRQWLLRYGAVVVAEAGAGGWRAGGGGGGRGGEGGIHLPKELSALNPNPSVVRVTGNHVRLEVLKELGGIARAEPGTLPQ